MGDEPYWTVDSPTYDPDPDDMDYLRYMVEMAEMDEAEDYDPEESVYGPEIDEYVDWED